MDEIWRDIKGFEGRYQVSNKGRIKAIQRDMQTGKGTRNIREHIWKGAENQQTGYFIVRLAILGGKGKRVSKYVHQLVAETFLDKPSGNVEVNHINERKADNRVENLEWVTHKQNLNHGTIKQRRKATIEKNRRK